MRVHRPLGFTLVEVLVTVGVIAMLLGVLLPSLAGARRSAQRASCLVNLRSLETAHWSHAADHSGALLGTTHGSSWTEVLSGYDPALLLRSPLDTSPHFPGGRPIGGRFRDSSYAITSELSPDRPGGIRRIDHVRAPARTVHMVLRAYTGAGAVSDHVHPSLWWAPLPRAIPNKAALEVQTHAYRGSPGTWDASSGYGFLDGHAAELRFREVYRTREDHSFLPRSH